MNIRSFNTNIVYVGHYFLLYLVLFMSCLGKFLPSLRSNEYYLLGNLLIYFSQESTKDLGIEVYSFHMDIQLISTFYNK